MSADLALFLQLVRVETLWYERLSDELQAAHGLPLSSYDVLNVVATVEACRVQDIAREIGITVGAVSKAVDRHEQAGWVARRANPADRRSSLVELTGEGRRLLDEATPLVATSLRARLAVLDAGRRAALADALAALREALDSPA
ncbi:MarR family transcriptional regulator [Agromyces sp. H3Y2-19a]|uniref:MarR family winged helix-turn-helix transcriptional regulator n=1 Tax=Agromyces TaxID=33877 RepID=UPI001E31AB34|nr:MULTISPECIES: MarR family transcriptional regulator [Agromyces]MCD5347558.1 MarR family transcriptional regulator [Agromyces sp. S2-1-8]MDF0514871.1 MarR family transcriptional regulator [Agromyces chromiiresistens]